MNTIKKFEVISAMFLVAGTCIGGGMLALPISTGIGGFIPSLAMMGLCWFFMTATGLLLIEASLWMKEEVHIISMVSRFLGPLGKLVSWFLYLFICYASLVAYGSSGGFQIVEVFGAYFGLTVSHEMAAFLFIILFTGIIALGSRLVGRVNAILFIAAVVAYVWLVVFGLSEIKPRLLLHHQWSRAAIAIPIVLTSFSFQTMAPSLTPILHRNPQALRWAVIGGTTITFAVYAVWQMIVLGIVPVDGNNGLTAALAHGDQPATQFLRQHVGGQWISTIAEYFAFFAIVTSFLGIALGLYDFLADGLHIPKKGFGTLLLGLIIIIPTWFFATHYERVFLLALDTTGGFGDAILNGIIPVLMVWVGRYSMKQTGAMRLFGGKSMLLMILAFYLSCLTLEVLSHLGWVPSIYDHYDVIEIHNMDQLLSMQNSYATPLLNT